MSKCKEELIAMLRDLESDCVERTVSMTNTDKFGQVICSFANDLKNLGYINAEHPKIKGEWQLLK